MGDKLVSRCNFLIKSMHLLWHTRTHTRRHNEIVCVSISVLFVVPEKSWRIVRRIGWDCEAHPQSVPLSTGQTQPHESPTGEWGSAWTSLTWGSRNINSQILQNTIRFNSLDNFINKCSNSGFVAGQSGTVEIVLSACCSPCTPNEQILFFR